MYMPSIVFILNHASMLCTMRTKVHLKQRAIELRKQGKSYREIRESIAVSKGTLSNWLSSATLSDKQQRFLVERTKILQDKGRLKSGSKARERNKVRKEALEREARELFYKHCNNAFFVLGTSLYWSSGTKNGAGLSFISSDPAQIRILMKWAVEYLMLEPADFRFRLYIPDIKLVQKAKGYWSRACEVPPSQFQEPTITSGSVQFNNGMGSLRLNMGTTAAQVTVATWQSLLSLYYIETR